jgi:hypothetical protein
MKRISVIAAVGLIITLLFLSFTAPSLGQGTTSTSIPATVEVAATMDVVPENCGELPDPIDIDPMIQGVVGMWPLWIAVPNANTEAKAILWMPDFHYHSEEALKGWWSTKVGWFVAKSYTGKVKVTGYNLADHSPIYFEFIDPLTDTAILDSAKPSGFIKGIDNFAFFPSGVWVSKAGCYIVKAEWDTGLWQQTIAVGTVKQ